MKYKLMNLNDLKKIMGPDGIGMDSKALEEKYRKDSSLFVLFYENTTAVANEPHYIIIGNRAQRSNSLEPRYHDITFVFKKNLANPDAGNAKQEQFRVMCEKLLTQKCKMAECGLDAPGKNTFKVMSNSFGTDHDSVQVSLGNNDDLVKTVRAFSAETILPPKLALSKAEDLYALSKKAYLTDWTASPIVANGMFKEEKAAPLSMAGAAVASSVNKKITPKGSAD